MIFLQFVVLSNVTSQRETYFCGPPCKHTK